jgi:hypothetical protein
MIRKAFDDPPNKTGYYQGCHLARSWVSTPDHGQGSSRSRALCAHCFAKRCLSRSSLRRLRGRRCRGPSPRCVRPSHRRSCPKPRLGREARRRRRLRSLWPPRVAAGELEAERAGRLLLQPQWRRRLRAAPSQGGLQPRLRPPLRWRSMRRSRTAREGFPRCSRPM